MPKVIPLTALALLIAATTTGPVTPMTLAEPDQAEIAALAQRYLENRAVKVTTGPQTPGFGVPLAPALDEKLRVHEVQLATALTTWPYSANRYRTAVVETRVDRFDVDQNRRTVVAQVHEHGELYFERPGTALYTGYSLSHLLTVQRTGNGWVLADVALGYYKACGLLPRTQAPTCEPPMS